MATPPIDPRYPFMGLPTALYCRASSDSNKEEKSVTDQEGPGLEWIKRERAVHFGTYSDNNRPGSRFTRKAREEFERLLTDVRAGRIKVIWIWTLSRSQRRLGVFASLRDLCREHGVRWVVDGRVYNLSDRGDRLALGITALQDEELPEQISEGVRRGQASSAAQGKPHSHVRYGYRRIYDPQTGKLIAEEIVEDLAAVLHEGWNRVIKGDTMYAIVSDLKKRGVKSPSGKDWAENTLKRTLLNPAYIGKRVYQGEVVGDGMWPPLVDEPTFYAARAILADPKRDTHERPRSIQHLLSFIAICDVCEKGMRVAKNNDSQAYKCYPASHAVVPKRALEEYIEFLVLARLARPDAAALFASPVDTQEVAAARDLAARQRATLSEYRALVRAGRLSPMGLAELEPPLLRDIADAEEIVKAATVDPILRGVCSADIAERWLTAEFPLNRKRQIIRAIVEIRIRPAGRGRRKFTQDRVVILWKRADGTTAAG